MKSSPIALPVIGDEREPIDVRIDCKTNCRARCLHEPFQITEVLGNRFRRPRKAAVRLEIDRRDLAAQPLEKRRHDRSAGAAAAVERDVEFARANTRDVEVRYRKDTIDVSLNGTRRPR